MRIAVNFYKYTLNLRSTVETDRISVFPLASTTLILFQLGLTEEDSHPKDRPELTVPGHGPTKGIVDGIINKSSSQPDVKERNDGMLLRQHYCLAVSTRKDVEDWEKHFKEHGVKVNGVMEWPKGGRSVYFADPDGHVGEIASRGIWPHY